MIRGMLALVGLVSCAALVGCGDDTAAGGGGTGGAPEGGGGSTSDGGGGAGAEATCAGYCSLIMGACVDTNSQYADQAACLLECAAYDQGDPGAMSGNNLECRQYHAGVADMMDAEVHCVHAGPLGGGAVAMNGCGTDRCETFCQVAEEVCADEASYSFSSVDDCTTQCQAYTDDVDFNIMVTTGDTLACRMYHVSVAATDGHGRRALCSRVRLRVRLITQTLS